jgi:hypothetical protein
MASLKAREDENNDASEAVVAKNEERKKKKSGIYYNYDSCSPWLQTPRAYISNKQGGLQFSAASRSMSSAPCSSTQARKIQHISQVKSRPEIKPLSLPPSKLLLRIRAYAFITATPPQPLFRDDVLHAQCKHVKSKYLHC